MWDSLHLVAHALPDELDRRAQDNVRAYLLTTAQLLPCSACGRHFEAHVRSALRDDAVLATRAGVVAMLNDAHNSVNRRLGKPQWTLEQHTRKYAGGGCARGVPPELAAACLAAALLVACALRAPRLRAPHMG
jgi:hypothetical protein